MKIPHSEETPFGVPPLGRRLWAVCVALVFAHICSAADPFAGMHARPPGETTLPLVDDFGQNAHAGWPGKIRTEDDLRSASAAEGRALETNPGPSGWNRYGGWTDGPRLAATGFFRTEKFRGNWWFVDPEGCLFFSFGVNAVGEARKTIVTGREDLFPSLPPRDGPLAKAWSTTANIHKGPLAGADAETFDFSVANLVRIHGPDFSEKATARIGRRLRSWGVNTLGGWTNRSVREFLRVPYTITVGHKAPAIEGAKLNWRKFPDPYHPGFLPALREGFDKQAVGSVGDPFCIGYFVDNELSWGEGETLATAVLESPASQPAKKEFARWLEEKYVTINAFNSAWTASHKSFEAFLESRDVPRSASGRDDLAGFTREIMTRYFSGVRDFLKSAAPHQLYLGPRFVHNWDLGGPSREIAAQFCDVISFTSYTDTFAEVRLPESLDRPLLIGEIGFGAADGRFYAGQLPWMKPVPDQAARAAKWRAWLTSATSDHRVVGVHWFTYADQPLTGRSFDGENFPFGFVDVTDRPYPEITAAQRTVADQTYKKRGASE
jgi:hypothetical protein